MIIAEPLTPGAFAPFGDVLAPAGARAFFDGALANGRSQAKPSLYLSRKPPLTALPYVATQMERHEWSSQTFVPMGPVRWLVLVAPHAATGGPDMAKARAFLPGPGQGVTYGMNVWHHPLTTIDAEGTFAVFMWRDGTKGDDEFVDIAPLTIQV